MEMDKIVNLDKEELALQAHQSAEQIFRLRFQMKMGQNEGLKKLRELKKDIARIKTVQRQHELGIATHAHVKVNASETEATPKRKKEDGEEVRRRQGREEESSEEDVDAEHQADIEGGRQSEVGRQDQGKGRQARQGECKEGRQLSNERTDERHDSNCDRGNSGRFSSQREGWRSGFHQDAEDHCGRGGNAQGPSEVSADDADDQEVLCA